MTRAILLVSSGLSLAACGASYSNVWEEPPTPHPVQEPNAEERHTKAVTEGDEHWAARGDQARLEKAIDAWKRATDIDENDHATLVKLSRAYYLLADGHLSFEGEAVQERFLETHDLGRRAADKALVALSPEFARRVRAGTRIEDAVSVLDRSAVPALYWRSTNLGKWAYAQGFTTVLSYKDEIRAVMQFCLEKEENYFYAGPHRYFGAFYAIAPPFAGGDLEQSLVHFQRAIEAHPNYFATRVLYAQHYAVKRQDRRLYEEQLNLVIAGNPAADPDVEPENRVEQKKARQLLAEADDKFE